MPMFNRVMNSYPGMLGVSIQAGIFQTGLGRGRNVDLDISGDAIDAIIAAARTLFGTLRQKLPDAQVRPEPSLENSYPEANFIPDRSRILANGISEADLGLAVDVIMAARSANSNRSRRKKSILSCDRTRRISGFRKILLRA
jgi:HAE1 family hydrophobic/amphiphilic exporter-1